ncbi:unnamed protein product [Boreogadus saida]
MYHSCDPEMVQRGVMSFRRASRPVGFEPLPSPLAAVSEYGRPYYALPCYPDHSLQLAHLALPPAPSLFVILSTSSLSALGFSIV